MKDYLICALLTTAFFTTGCLSNSYQSNSMANGSKQNAAVPVNNGTDMNAHSNIATDSNVKREDYDKSKTGSTSSLPPFPMPPNASVEFQVTSLVKNPNGQTTFGFVDEKLKQALSANGYEKTSYYAVEGGFVITTQMEQFQPNGQPVLRGRFDDAPSSPTLFQTEFWINALRGKKGRYRVIAFMITDQNPRDDAQTPSVTRGRELITYGAKFLPAEMRSLPLTDSHICLALVYEYGQDRKTGEINYLRPGTLPAATQLKNLLDALRRG